MPRRPPRDPDSPPDSDPGPPGPARAPLLRWLPLLLLAAGLAVVLATGLQRYLTFDALRDNRAWLLDLVARHFAVAAVGFVAIYIVVVALSVPGGAVLTIAGGFLFGKWIDTALVLVAATIGATLLFLAARTALAPLLRARAAPWLIKLEAGFRRDAFSYLLVLRLVPLFPFFVVNLVPAFLGVSLRVFMLATLIGIIPGTFVYATVGSGLGSIFDSGQSFTAAGILTPEIVGALVGLAVLALIPVAYRQWSRRRQRASGSP
jgi:uncharacterized membrane protein YdjX (TVP38/TMEM64 family)